jgi:hypothetical protein
MKPMLLFACLVLFSPTMAQGVRTIKVDEEHSLVNKPKAAPLFYSIQPGLSLELDATGYTFPIVSNMQPNVIYVALGKGKKYSARWVANQTRYTLSAATLTAVPGTDTLGTFEGFAAGTTGRVAIGYESSEYAPGFYWDALFKVQ